MIGSESIDLSLKNIWQSWFAFRKGKKATDELHKFQYYLEKNLSELFEDLNSGRYRHGSYRKFIVCDNKRREISVASIRDRVVHHLVYDYLEKIYDKIFIYDAWSCRKGKGLLGAIERTACFLKRSITHTHTHTPPSHFPHVWKCDIKKFFDSVDQEILLKILSFRIKDSTTLNLLKEIISSFTTVSGNKIGMPIGNLTSQIFANIYLNELDRFVKHELAAKSYLRYGDDFIIVENDLEKLKLFRTQVIDFLRDKLKLAVNPKSDKILKPSHGLKFLGINFWPFGKNLNKRSLNRAQKRLNQNNLSSYSGLIKQHCNRKNQKKFTWLILEKFID